jgi:hypothetical protein
MKSHLFKGHLQTPGTTKPGRCWRRGLVFGYPALLTTQPRRSAGRLARSYVAPAFRRLNRPMERQ